MADVAEHRNDVEVRLPFSYGAAVWAIQYAGYGILAGAAAAFSAGWPAGPDLPLVGSFLLGAAPPVLLALGGGILGYRVGDKKR